MADEQPGYVNRDVRDVTGVPLAKDLVRDNVGSTVKNNSNFSIVSKAESVEASAHYLDAAILAKHSPPATSPDEALRAKNTRDVRGNKPAVGREAIVDRPAARPVSVGKESYAGPVVIMSDSDNYIDRAGGYRRCVKIKCVTCCVG